MLEEAAGRVPAARRWREAFGFVCCEGRLLFTVCVSAALFLFFQPMAIHCTLAVVTCLLGSVGNPYARNAHISLKGEGKGSCVDVEAVHGTCPEPPAASDLHLEPGELPGTTALARKCKADEEEEPPDVARLQGSSHRYCIVGAGPGGLQAGHFLQVCTLLLLHDLCTPSWLHRRLPNSPDNCVRDFAHVSRINYAFTAISINLNR